MANYYNTKTHGYAAQLHRVDRRWRPCVTVSRISCRCMSARRRLALSAPTRRPGISRATCRSRAVTRPTACSTRTTRTRGWTSGALFGDCRTVASRRTPIQCTYRAAMVPRHVRGNDEWNDNMGSLFSRRPDITTELHLPAGPDGRDRAGQFNFATNRRTARRSATVFPPNYKPSSKLSQIQVVGRTCSGCRAVLNVAVAAGSVSKRSTIRARTRRTTSAPTPVTTVNGVGVGQAPRLVGLRSRGPDLGQLRVKAEVRTTAIRPVRRRSRRSSKPNSADRARSSCADLFEGLPCPELHRSFGCRDRLHLCTNQLYVRCSRLLRCALLPNPAYYSGGYNQGLTSVGNPDLNPEKSTSLHLRRGVSADARTSRSRSTPTTPRSRT